MKKIFVFCLLLSIGLVSFSQSFETTFSEISKICGNSIADKIKGK